MLTFQDFEASADKKQFILEAIEKFKNSDFYRNAIDSQNYYKGENTTILNRLQWFFNSSGAKEEDRFKANNRICNEFFPKIVKQEVSYLLANGVTVDENIKEGLGNMFDINFMKAGTYSVVDGVGWTYCYINAKKEFATQIFRGTEVVPLFDELSGELMACIRFWQIDTDKPLYIELYEKEGKTTYRKPKNSKAIEELEARKPYILKKETDILGERIVGEVSFSVLPIIPLYCNDVKQSEFTIALKTKLDLYDIILSDFGNNLEDSQDVYWVLKNYQGQDMSEFLADYKYYKTIKVDDDGDATAKTIDVPYEARKQALDIIESQIYKGAMALDTSILSGGSITNVAIKANMQDLDLKVDGFEMEAIATANKIVDLYLEYKNQSNTKYKVQFIRRSLINDTEIIDNIYKMRTDISLKTALKLNPYIEDEEEEIDLIEEEGMRVKTIEDNTVDNKVIEEV